MGPEPPSNENRPPVGEGKIASLIAAVKGLTFANAAIIIMLALVSAPIYVIYRAVNDNELLDRLLSTYKTLPSTSTCLLREIGERGSENRWIIVSGFAMQGGDRWQIAVSMDHHPDVAQEASYCESLKLMIDRLREAPELPQ